MPLCRFEEVTVIVGIIRISLSTHIFVLIRGALVKEVILASSGDGETGLELGVLSS